MQKLSVPSEFVVIDVETTGFKPEEGHEIVEIAGQKIGTSGIVEVFQSLVMPTRTLDPTITAFNGITEMLLRAEGHPSTSVIPRFIDFIGSAVLIGHNIPFDIGFINAHLSRLDLPALHNATLDTLELSRRYLILPSYSLQSVAHYLHIPQPQAHRAMADVETTRLVFLKLVERAMKVGK